MVRTKRLYPLGRYRLRVPKDAEADKAYPVVLEYTWNRQIIRSEPPSTDVCSKEYFWICRGAKLENRKNRKQQDLFLSIWKHRNII